VFENRMLVRIFATKTEDKIVEGLKMGLFVAVSADEY
jgi:hypothetical protein